MANAVPKSQIEIHKSADLKSFWKDDTPTGQSIRCYIQITAHTRRRASHWSAAVVCKKRQLSRVRGLVLFADVSDRFTSTN